MKLAESLSKAKWAIVHLVHRFQYIILSIAVIGIVDYFFLYELSVTLMSLMATGAIPVLAVIFAVILVRGAIKYAKRKAKENKHRLIF